MRVLFYIEPVVFRMDATWLTGHINNVRCFVNANWSEDVEYGLATSQQHMDEYDRWLQYGGHDIRRFPISPRLLIEPFGFDRFAYAADLYAPEVTANKNLTGALEAIALNFAPEIVISISENSYLTAAFKTAKVAFHEIGPIPRKDGRNNYYFDFGGHGMTSILSRRIDDVLALPIADSDARSLFCAFRDWFVRQPSFQPAAEQFRKWRQKNAHGKKTALIAVQPSDNISLEGTMPSIPLDTFVMKILGQLPADWMGILTYHSQMQVSPTMENYIAREFSNLLVLPEELRIVGSDPFVEEIDAIITVNSKSALSAALFGKRVVTFGQSMLNGFGSANISNLDQAQALTAAEAGRILAFISNRYSFSFEECFEQNGVILDFLRKAVASSDAQDFQLSLEDWKPADLIRLLN